MYLFDNMWHAICLHHVNHAAFIIYHVPHTTPCTMRVNHAAFSTMQSFPHTMHVNYAAFSIYHVPHTMHHAPCDLIAHYIIFGDINHVLLISYATLHIHLRSIVYFSNIIPILPTYPLCSPHIKRPTVRS